MAASKEWIAKNLIRALAREDFANGVRDGGEKCLSNHAFTLAWCGFKVPQIVDIYFREIKHCEMIMAFPVSEMELKPAANAIDEAIGVMMKTRKRLETQERRPMHDEDKLYFTTKVVVARKATSTEVEKETGRTISASVEQGYRVQYPDGYVSWCPKEVFEACSRQFSDDELEMADDIIVRDQSTEDETE